MFDVIVFAAALGTTYLGILFFRRWSVKKGFLDVPNARSSHVLPTPRGGGVVIVAVVLGSYLLISYFYPSTFSYGYLAGAILIAIVSWLDDIYSVSFIWRFLTHSVAAILLIVDKGPWIAIHISNNAGEITLGAWGPIMAFLWVVWLVNAYNFMDGIDGIAGLQAAVAGFAWMILGQMESMPGIYYFGSILLFSAIGFLIHNWQPARVFMGDVGSVFLGFTFAAIPFLAGDETGRVKPFLPVAAMLFVWFFLFDSVITFARRIARREKVWVAHREHLYQRLVASGLSHALVTTLYASMALAMVIAVLLAIKWEEIFAPVLAAQLVVLSVGLIVLCIRRRALT